MGMFFGLPRTVRQLWLDWHWLKLKWLRTADENDDDDDDDDDDDEEKQIYMSF